MGFLRKTLLVLQIILLCNRKCTAVAPECPYVPMSTLRCITYPTGFGYFFWYSFSSLIAFLYFIIIYYFISSTGTFSQPYAKVTPKSLKKKKNQRLIMKSFLFSLKTHYIDQNFRTANMHAYFNKQ